MKSLKVLELAKLVNRKAFPTPPERVFVNDNDQALVETPRRVSPSHLSSPATPLAPRCDPGAPGLVLGLRGRANACPAELEARETVHRTA